MLCVAGLTDALIAQETELAELDGEDGSAIISRTELPMLRTGLPYRAGDGRHLVQTPLSGIHASLMTRGGLMLSLRVGPAGSACHMRLFRIIKRKKRSQLRFGRNCLALIRANT